MHCEPLSSIEKITAWIIFLMSRPTQEQKLQNLQALDVLLGIDA